MHEDFPKLFAEISVDGAERAARWKGVEAFAEAYSVAKAEVLVRLAFGTKPPPGGHQQPDLEAALAAFRKAFSDADPSVKPGGRQDQILAAACLLHLFNVNSLAAMAVTTTAFGGARRAALPVDLVASAENAIARLGALRRKRPDLGKLEVEVPDFAFEPDFAAVQVNQPATFKGVFDQFGTAVDEALAELTGKFNESIKTLVAANRKADEELDMLSWVFGGRALVPAIPFGDVPAAQKPLVLARDLASVTAITPGPSSMTALLARAGVKAAGKVTVAECVNAVSDAWTAAVLKDRRVSPASSPIHFALVRRQETGAGDGWQAGWTAITGIDAATALPPIRLAELFYREILWAR
jgi:hypothetical protein